MSAHVVWEAPYPEGKELDDILYSFSRYVAHHEFTGLSTGKYINQTEAKKLLLQWRTKSLLALLDSILNKSDIAWVERGELRSHETFVHTNVIRDIKSKLGEDK